MKGRFYWMVIQNERQLKNAMMVQMKKAMKFASDKIANEIAESVQSKTTLGDSEYYNATYQFFNSVIIPKIETSGFSVSVTIGMDYTQMQSMEQERGYNAHMSFDGSTEHENKSIPEWLLSWWDEGTYNNGKEVKSHKIEKTNYWKNVMGDRGTADNPNYEKMFKKFRKYFEEELKKIGMVKKI